MYGTHWGGGAWSSACGGVGWLLRLCGVLGLVVVAFSWRVPVGVVAWWGGSGAPVCGWVGEVCGLGLGLSVALPWLGAWSGCVAFLGCGLCVRNVCSVCSVGAGNPVDTSGYRWVHGVRGVTECVALRGVWCWCDLGSLK